MQRTAILSRADLGVSLTDRELKALSEVPVSAEVLEQLRDAVNRAPGGKVVGNLQLFLADREKGIVVRNLLTQSETTGLGQESVIGLGGAQEALSAELRTSDTQFMRRRRQVVCLSLTSAACMGVVAAYQIGLLEHVPEPSLPGFDADAVDASAQAYETLSTEDAFIGFVS